MPKSFKVLYYDILRGNHWPTMYNSLTDEEFTVYLDLRYNYLGSYNLGLNE